MAAPITHRGRGGRQRLPVWAQPLRSEADIANDVNAVEMATQPELSQLKSLSHEGRVRYHVKPWKPRGGRAAKVSPRFRPEEEEQLLYVALYRDKIAEHQASLQMQKSKEAARSRADRRQRLQAAVVDGAAEATESLPGEHDVMLGEGADDEASAMDDPSSPTIGAIAPGLSLPALSSSAAPTSENKKAAHIASVVSAPGAGGVATEFLETKRLGKLFDEWNMLQEATAEEYVPSFGHSDRAPSARFADDGGSARHAGGAGGGSASSAAPSPAATPKAKSVASQIKSPSGPKSPTGPRGKGQGSQEKKKKKRLPKEAHLEASEELHGSAEQGLSDTDVNSAASDDSGHRVTRISESKLVSRLFQVVTNPKVTGEAVGDPENTRKVPNYVEGFPTLNLMRLHRGPWRLEH